MGADLSDLRVATGTAARRPEADGRMDTGACWPSSIMIGVTGDDYACTET